MKAAYVKYLTHILGKKWVKDNPEVVAHWWLAPITGGAFRAGVRAGKKAAKEKSP